MSLTHHFFWDCLFSLYCDFDEGEPWHSSKVVPKWPVDHGFESGNNLFAYARVRLCSAYNIPLPYFLMVRSFWAMGYGRILWFWFAVLLVQVCTQAGIIFGSQPAKGYAQGSQMGWLHMQIAGGFEKAT